MSFDIDAINNLLTQIEDATTRIRQELAIREKENIVRSVSDIAPDVLRRASVNQSPVESASTTDSVTAVALKILTAIARLQSANALKIQPLLIAGLAGYQANNAIFRDEFEKLIYEGLIVTSSSLVHLTAKGKDKVSSQLKRLTTEELVRSICTQLSPRKRKILQAIASAEKYRMRQSEIADLFSTASDKKNFFRDIRELERDSLIVSESKLYFAMSDSLLLEESLSK